MAFKIRVSHLLLCMVKKQIPAGPGGNTCNPNWAWWHTPATPAGRGGTHLQPQNFGAGCRRSRSLLSVVTEFDVNLGYMRPCLQNGRKKSVGDVTINVSAWSRTQNPKQALRIYLVGFPQRSRIPWQKLKPLGKHMSQTRPCPSTK